MAVTNPEVWALTDEQRALLESWLVEFDQSWDESRLAARVSELPAAGPIRLPALVELVKIDLERNWQQAKHVTVESYLRDYPELGTPETVPADLLVAEYEARRQHGEDASVTGFAERFPQRIPDLRRLVEQELPIPAGIISTVNSAPGPSTLDAPRQRPDLDPLPERFGRYHIVRRLGQGGMGTVYLARDTQLDRFVAFKVLRFAAGDSSGAVERFHREARSAATLRHANICPVYDFGQIDTVHYLTMAYIEGKSLAERIKAGPPLLPPQSAALVRQLALALEVAHGQGIIHRDLKPANVMIDRDGEPVVMDFGLARRAGKGDVNLTQSGAILGTPAYMSPEQVDGNVAAMGPGCDIYSLGVILYELLTGRPPFQGSLTDVLCQIKFQEPERPSRLRPDLSQPLEEITMHAMAKKIEDRYRTMGEFATALTGYLREEEVRSGPVNRLAPYLTPPVAPPKGRPEKPSRRRRWAVAAALLGAVVLLASGIVIRFRDKDGKEKVIAVPDAAPGTKVVVETPKGEVLGTAKVPDKPAGQDTPRTPGAGPLFLKGDIKSIYCLEFSPDSKRVAFGGNGETVELWDVLTGKRRTILKDNPQRVSSLAFSPDGMTLAAGCYKQVKLWKTDTGEVVRTLKGHTADVRNLQFIPGDKPLFSASIYEAKLWDAASGADQDVVKADHAGWTLSPDGKTLVRFNNYWNHVVFRNVAKGEDNMIRFSWTRCAAISRDSRTVAVGAAEKVVLWEAATGKNLGSHNLHAGKVNSVAISPDGTVVASGSEDKTVILWDMATKKERATLGGAEGPVAAKFCPNGKVLASWSSASKTVKLWDVTTGKERSTLSGESQVLDLSFSPDDKWLATVEKNGIVRLWDIAGVTAGTK